jgi:hypothetical protein
MIEARMAVNVFRDLTEAWSIGLMEMEKSDLELLENCDKLLVLVEPEQYPGDQSK